MRTKVIGFLKQHPIAVNTAWKCAELFLKTWSVFIPIEEKTILFCSFGGRKFDDSPKAIYDEICSRSEFSDWNIKWAFVEPEAFNVERGDKIKIDTKEFFKALITSRVQISNSGMTRGISFNRKGIIKVETWHGTPLKKIGGDENQNSLGGKQRKKKSGIDRNTIRCAQSDFDRDIFSRIFNADKECILLSDLPRNDALLTYSSRTIEEIKTRLDIPSEKRVILYTPTYREYLVDEHRENYIAPPMNLLKWQKLLGNKYVLLFRAHYAVNRALDLEDNEFVKDVSLYPTLNDLYAISDLMISDYSSTFFDYSILNRPMFCFAYDLEEYEEKRGLYLNIEATLPCTIDRNEDDVIKHILGMNEIECIERTREFHNTFAPYAGGASKKIVDEIERKLI